MKSGDRQRFFGRPAKFQALVNLAPINAERFRPFGERLGLAERLNEYAVAGTAGMTVDMTHLTVYEGASVTSGGIQAAEHWALFDGCCGRLRALRQKQRDDSFNAPRKWGLNNNPTSRQHSLRKAPGSNTYLKDDLLVDCGC